MSKKVWTENDITGFKYVANGGHIEDQPPPVSNDRPAVWDLVMQDMAERDFVGRERYGTPLQPHNGRDALVDAYQEALDMVVYLRQAIYERGQPKSRLRCGSCDHDVTDHAEEGCWYTVSSGRVDANLVCVCALTREQLRA